MRTEHNSFIQQIIGRKVTIISLNLTGTIIYAEVTNHSRNVDFTIRVKYTDKKTFKSFTKDKEISLSLVGLLKDCRFHALT